MAIWSSGAQWYLLHSGQFEPGESAVTILIVGQPKYSTLNPVLLMARIANTPIHSLSFISMVHGEKPEVSFLGRVALGLFGLVGAGLGCLAESSP
jgi:hypothetical protein